MENEPVTTRADSQDRPDAPLPACSEPTAKLPYERPRVLFREPLEAVAAVCDPMAMPPGKANFVDCAIGSS